MNPMSAPNTMEYEMVKLQLTNHHKQITQYNENKVKMLGFILHHCSEESFTMLDLSRMKKEIEGVDLNK
jgi:hypothetical protein